MSSYRESILHLVGDPHLRIREAVFAGLRPARQADEILCWNALRLALSLTVTPSRIARLDDWEKRRALKEVRARRLLRSQLRHLENDEAPELPRLSARGGDRFLADLAIPALTMLPLDELMMNPAAKTRLLRLARDLVGWTIERNTPASDNPRQSIDIPYGWNHLFLRWLACLARSLSLPEARLYVLAPIREAWGCAPHLTAELLHGYLYCQLSPMGPLSDDSQAGWREISDWVLRSNEVAEAADSQHLPKRLADVLALVVFVENSILSGSTSAMKAEWPHAALFADVIGRWVEVVGYHPDAYAHLLTMLDKPGWQLAPVPALTWLRQASEAASDRFRLWESNDNGLRTGILLVRMWMEKRKAIRSQPAILATFTDLVDDLAAAGVTVAGALQRELEGHGEVGSSETG